VCRSKRADDESEGDSFGGGGEDEEGSLNSDDVADMVMGDSDGEPPSDDEDDDEEVVQVPVRGRGGRVSAFVLWRGFLRICYTAGTSHNNCLTVQRSYLILCHLTRAQAKAVP
jgi:hypothetical protein